MDGFTLSDILAIIAICVAALAALIAYLIMIAQYLIGRFTPLIIPVCLRRFVARVPTPWSGLVLGAIAMCLAVALLPLTLYAGPASVRALAALLGVGLLIWSLAWLSLAMYRLLVEVADSASVVGWLATEKPQLRRAAFREILAPALTRMDLEAIKAVIAQSLANGVDDENVVLASLLALRRGLGAQWIALHVLDEILSDLDANALRRRRPIIEAILAEALRAGSPDVAVSIVDRLWAIMQTTCTWERIHSETITALGAIIWEVRPSDESLPHHPWLDRPMAEVEGHFIQSLAQIAYEFSCPEGDARTLHISLEEYCWILHCLLANALDPEYLLQLLRVCQQLIWFCPRECLIVGPIVQQLCYGLQSGRTCVYRGSQQDPTSWREPARLIDETAVDLAALVAVSNKPQLFASVMRSGAFMHGISSILAKPEIIPMDGYDAVGAQLLQVPLAGMALSEWLRRKQSSASAPDLPIPVATLVNIKASPIAVTHRPWPSQ